MLVLEIFFGRLCSCLALLAIGFSSRRRDTRQHTHSYNTANAKYYL